MFKFYLNNQIVSDPINWSDFTETIERDDTIKGVLPKYEQKLSFSGGGYTYLYEQKRVNGFCDLVELRVDQQIKGVFETVLNGLIFISDCEFNLSKNIVECPVQDNNYSAMIYNNKSIELFLDSTLSKNGVQIPACENKNVIFFTPSTGNDAATIKCYPVWSVFKYIIQFISDNKIDFESDYLDYLQSQSGGNEQRGLVITTGAMLRSSTNNKSPKVSFDGLFKEVCRKFPIAFTVLTQNNGRPLIKIEQEDSLFGEDSGVVINNIEDLVESINSELLYSEIEIGGTTATYNSSIHTIPDTYRMFFQKESYYFKTKCNIDKKLDLTTKFICDSNIIEELVATNTSNNSYDDEVFLVQVQYNSGILGTRAIKQSLGNNLAPFYYNPDLTNSNSAKNFNIYSDLTQYIYSNDIGFQATKTSGYQAAYHVYPADYSLDITGRLITRCSVPVLVTFEDDSTPPNNDPANNYTANSRYTAPSPGHYYFKSALIIRMQTYAGYTNPNVKVNFTITLRRYNSANVLQESFSNVSGGNSFATFHEVYSTGQKFLLEAERTFFMQAGDYVQVYFSWCSIPWKAYDINGYYNGSPSGARAEILAIPDTYFKTLSTESNGTLVSASNSQYYPGNLRFEYPLTQEKYSILKSDLSKSLTVNHKANSNKTGWIRRVVRNIATGKTTWELQNKDI